jgi:hypothetical protein
MQVVLLVILAAGLVVSLPVELGLWRAGRISDRITAILLITRFPTLSFLATLIVGLSLQRSAEGAFFSLLPGLVLYPYVHGRLREETAKRRSIVSAATSGDDTVRR